MRRCSLALTAFVAILAVDRAEAQPSSAPCGDTVTVQRGDTLSRIAERCDVTERSLMRLNPRIEGSRDLRVGMQIQARGSDTSGTNALDRLGAIADQTADSLAGIARDIGSSAQDLLDKNPDLRQRLESFTQRLSGGTTGPNQGKAPVQGMVTVSPTHAAAGSSVAVTAQGLPQDASVVIGAGAPQAAYEIIDRTRTAADGRLQFNIRVPDWASDLGRLVIVVAANDGSWTVRSAPLQVTGGKL